MARPLTPFLLPTADRSVLESFTRKGCHPVRAVRRAQALLALATGIGHWHRPLASATGIGHWHRPLASASKRPVKPRA
jgi:hypothetical protein